MGYPIPPFQGLFNFRLWTHGVAVGFPSPPLTGLQSAAGATVNRPWPCLVHVQALLHVSTLPSAFYEYAKYMPYLGIQTTLSVFIWCARQSLVRLAD